jgi:prolyl oligopeptidase
MRYLILILSLFIVSIACKEPAKDAEEATALTYPESRKDDVSDDYFGTVVADPYRWLEIDTSEEVGAWVTEQNKVTFDYLEQIDYRPAIKDRLSKIWNYPKYGAPFRKGSRYYYYKNDGLQNQSVLYYMEELGGEAHVFIDPNTLSEDGTTSLGSVSWSKDAKYCAYQTSSGGSDWKDIQVMEVETGQLLDDHLQWIKFSGISWYEDGFYYSRYDAPEGGEKLSGKNEYHKVFYHRLGTEQSEDELVFEDPSSPQRNFYAQTTDDERFLAVYASQSTSGNMLYVKDQSRSDADFVHIIQDFDHDVDIVDNVGDRLYVITNIEADNNRLIAIDPTQPAPENWMTLIGL